MKNKSMFVHSGIVAAAAVFAALIGLHISAAAQQQPATAAPPSPPKVSGPIANTTPLKDAAHGYPFNATPMDLKVAGYVEEEYFMEGAANRYAQPIPQRGGPGATPATPPSPTATIQDSGHPYKTRIVVRRPANAARFNGTAVVEWLTVDKGHDEEIDWLESGKHFVRAGYAWIGVSTQPAGVDALKQWSPARYSTLNVTPPAPPAPQFGLGRGGPQVGRGAPAVGAPRGEQRGGEREGRGGGERGERGGERGERGEGGRGAQLARGGFGFPGQDIGYDIFTEAALAVRGKSNVDVMGGLKVQQLIATGYAQSAGRLGTYFNTIHPLTPVFDGVLLHDGGGKIRTDLDVKVFKVLTETGVFGGRELDNRQDDTNRLRSWEVAGTSTVDAQISRALGDLGLRAAGATPVAGVNVLQGATISGGAAGLGSYQTASSAADEGCSHPVLTRTPFHYVLAAAYDHLARWIKDGTNPPTGPRFEVFEGPPEAPRRERSGQAVGGIQLAQYAVPIAVNRGDNAPVESAGGGAAGIGPGRGGIGFGQQTPVVGQFCNVLGWYEPYDAAKLSSRYPTHDDYVKAVRDATEKNLKSGFIVKADADATIAEAEASAIGKR